MVKEFVFFFIRYLVRCFNPRLVASSKVIFRGFPSISISRDASIKIMEGCVINSLQYRYHVHMYNRAYFFAEGEGSCIRIGSKTRIHGSCIHARNSIEIGSRCLIAANCQIIDSNAHELSFDFIENRTNTIDVPRPVTIGDDVWIGCNSIILSGSKIGDGSVVMAGSVVRGEFPKMAIIGGNPAKILSIR